MSKRAERRFHKNRLKKKAKKIYPDWDKAFHNADNLQKCSCNGCCNIRRSDFFKGESKLTVNEQRFKASANEQENND